MKENSHLEFRQQVTSAFLKTVSAFANGEGGKIVFVRAADGSISPPDSPEQAKLSIEKSIRDSISPIIRYLLLTVDVQLP